MNRRRAIGYRLEKLSIDYAKLSAAVALGDFSNTEQLVEEHLAEFGPHATHFSTPERIRHHVIFGTIGVWVYRFTVDNHSSPVSVNATKVFHRKLGRQLGIGLQRKLRMKGPTPLPCQYIALCTLATKRLRLAVRKRASSKGLSQVDK